MRSSTLLPDVRACHLLACLEKVVAVARQFQDCPPRPKLTFFTLLEPTEHHLPYFMCGNPDLFLAIYDCEPHLIDAGTAPLLSLRAERSNGCTRECAGKCTGKCAGDLHVELYVSELFTLKDFEVRLIIAETLELDAHPWAQVPGVWDTCVHKLPEQIQDKTPEATPYPVAGSTQLQQTRQPESPTSISGEPMAELRSLFSRRLPSTEYLFGELVQLDDPHDNAHLFTPWLEHIKADYAGEYPAYPRRAFDLACDRCIARMKKEGIYKPKPPSAMAAD